MSVNLVSRRSLALAVSAMTAFAVIVPVSPAAADTAPPADVPTTVSSDGLPTVQINGVVWTQVTIGNTVIAAGEFTDARPAGSPPGQNTVPRQNMLAFDIRTGDLIADFDPSFNGQVLGLATSPDESVIYAVGDFTAVDGQDRYRIAALDSATGELIGSFRPQLRSRAYDVDVASDGTVYVAGQFPVANNVDRGRLAAFNPSGDLLDWAPVADAKALSITLSPDQSRVIVGGQFTTLNGEYANGMGSVDAVTGEVLPWAINRIIVNGGRDNSGIGSLRNDGQNIVGSGWWYGGADKWEGAFIADPNTGEPIWIEDCHGDSYDALPMGDVVYVMAHAHYCDNLVDGFPEQRPNNPVRRALAFSSDPTSQLLRNRQSGYANLQGQTSPSLLHWFPDMPAGTYTGQSQSAWSATGNDDYLVAGGEFAVVNNTGQQGLVRFPVVDIAPNDDGPRFGGTDLQPALQSVPGAGVRVTFQSSYDRDNRNLSYEVVRDGNRGNPVYAVTAPSTFWDRPTLGFLDGDVVAGQTYEYQVVARDPWGNSAFSTTASIVAPDGSGVAPPYADAVFTSGPNLYWRLGENAGVAIDWAGSQDGAVGSGVEQGVPGAIGDSAETAYRCDGSSNGIVATQSPAPGPQVFSLEAWFNTTTTSGGKILGFGNAASGASSSHDRHIYMNGAGRLTFGVNPGESKTIDSAGPYNDGQWHHVVATLSASGMAMYVDGDLVADDPTVTTAQDLTGYWRLCGDNINNWPNAGDRYFDADVDEVAIYPRALSAAEVARHYEVGTSAAPPANEAPSAVFTATPSGLDVAFDGSGSADGDGSIVSYEWDFGDGSSGTGETASHSYGAGGTFSVTLTVTDDDGAATSVSQDVTVEVPNEAPSAVFTATPSGLDVAFDGSGSADGDGSIVSYEWDFGDGSSGTGETASHSYGAGGTFSVTLTVTDDDGAATSVSQDVTVEVPNEAPSAVFTATPSGLDVAFDGSGSADGDGSIVSYEWDFGDGSSGTGETASHSYGAGGTFSVTLTVTDDDGAATAVTQQVLVEQPPPANEAPSAVFTATPSGLDVAFDGSGSADGDGSIVSYEWDFGDGSSGTGETASYSYGAGGTFSVTLTVTDDDGAATSVSQDVTVEVPNEAPSAVFTATPSGLDVAFDGSGSADGDGSIVSYEWDFGDGSSGTGETASHSYGAGGTFSVTLTVTDDDGAATAVTQQVLVEQPPPANEAPSAVFTATPSGLDVAFDGSGSADGDGSIVSYEWDFGDGSSGTGETASHSYGAGGTFSVTLTVTDDDGAATAVTQQVLVEQPPPANEAPSAVFTATPSGLDVAFDGSGSADGDGSIVSYEWDFGDGSSGTGETASHSYGAGGTFSVTLTVTDDDGAATSVSQDVTVEVPNEAPSAVFTATPSGLDVAFDGSGSADGDGSIVSYEWDFGDGSSGTGETASHSYGAGGTFSVTLTVTDDDGAATSVSQDVTVDDDPGTAPVAFVEDAFERSVSGGWGVADTGGSWSTSGTSSSYEVSGGTGRVTLNQGQGRTASLDSVSSVDTDLQVGVSLDEPSTGGGVFVSVLGRAVGSTDYRAKVQFRNDGSVRLDLVRQAGAQILLDREYVSGLTYVPGDQLLVRLRVVGTSPTQLQAKVWLAGSPEPGWQVEATDDSAALQSVGSVGLLSYLSGSATTAPITVSYDNLTGTPSGSTSPPVNEAPSAVFTATPSGLDVAFDGSGSADGDGSIVSYEWDFGDGSSGTGETASHSYGAGGTFSVTLTVTDDDGAATSVSQDVTVDDDPGTAPVAFVEDAFERSVSGGWGVADTGGSWSTSGTSSSYEVSGGTGRVTLNQGQGRTASLDSVSSVDTDLQVGVSLDEPSTGGGVFVSVLGRAVGSTDYRAKVQFRNDGSVRLDLVRQAGAQILLDREYVSGLTYVPGDQLLVRLRVVGTSPTQLQAKVWLAGSPEPGWQVEATDDSAALQSVGSVGLLSYLSGSATTAPITVSYDDVVARPSG